jgi:isopenicillin N synthase-like dioxygenase
MNNRKVPELSLLSYVNGSNTEKTRFVDNLFAGLKDYGFIVLVDHTVDEKVTKNAYELIHAFFQMEKEIKQKYVCSVGGGQRGYTAFGVEHAKNNPFPDLKEFWHVGRDVAPDSPLAGSMLQNIWPDVPEFKETFQLLFAEMDKVGARILSSIARYLDLPADWFDPTIEDGTSILRLLHYPPIAGDAEGCVGAIA